MTNPFIYGQIVQGDYFADRKTELKGLVTDLAQNSRIFLISPRRYGKTSLVLSALSELKNQGFFTAQLDMYKTTSLEQFLAFYSKALAKASETKLESIVQSIREALASLRPKIQIDSQGDVSVSVERASSKKDAFLLLEQVLNSPEEIARKKGRGFVVFFDEFQEIQTLGGENLEKFVRATIQHHHNVSYIFAGSKQHTMVDMVNKRTRAFYKMGKVQFLGRIPRQEFIDFISSRFSQTGFTLEKGVPELVLDLTNEIPHYVQHLCHELWNEYRDAKKITPGSIPETIQKIVLSQSPVHLSTWDGLSLHQRRLLQALSRGIGRNLFSQEFIRLQELGSPSSVQTSLRRLAKKDIIQKENGEYSFSDVWLKEWVKTTIP